MVDFQYFHVYKNVHENVHEKVYENVYDFHWKSIETEVERKEGDPNVSWRGVNEHVYDCVVDVMDDETHM